MIGCLTYGQNCELQKYSGWLKNLEHHLCGSKLSSLKPKFESFHGDGRDDDNDAVDVQWTWSGVTKIDRLTWTDLLIFLRFASSIREMSSALESNQNQSKWEKITWKAETAGILGGSECGSTFGDRLLPFKTFCDRSNVTFRKIGRMTYF